MGIRFKKTALICSKCGYGNDPSAMVCNLCQQMLQSTVAAPRKHCFERPGAAPIPLEIDRTLTIGRLPSNDIAVPSSSVSRLHAEIRWSNDRIVLLDRSSNGTLVNGRPVASCVLEHGDQLQIGPFLCTYACTGGLSSAASSSNAQARTQAAADPGLLGVLHSDTLAEQMQNLEMTRKTGTLHVFGIGAGRQGWIAFQEGRPTAAEIDDERDVAAILRMLNLTHGRFVILPELQIPEARIHGSLTSILLEAARRKDEAVLNG